MSIIEPASTRLKTLLAVASTAVLAMTMTAGLWPFSFHRKNEVRWEPEKAGLYFGGTGIAISDGKFAGATTNGASIELWIEPGITWASSTILSFYQPGMAPAIQVRQSGDDLAFTSIRGSNRSQGRKRNLFVDHAFRKNEAIFVVLTSSDKALDIYINSVLRKSAINLHIQGADFAGTLILANAYDGNLSWTGTIRGLALYDRALQPQEISEDYDRWRHDRDLMTQKTGGTYSLYLFEEHGGTVLHNVGKAGPDLVIPENYFIFEPGFLVPFWKEYRPSWEYAKDLAINIVGLVPIGCCFAALLAWLSGRKRSLLYTALLGFCVSLTIEVLQAFMPTRSSGTTDLITNTAGAALGGWLYLNAKSQACLQRLGVVRAK